MESTTNWNKAIETYNDGTFNQPPHVVDSETYEHPKMENLSKEMLRHYSLSSYRDYAKLFVVFYGHKYRYVPERDKWLVFRDRDVPHLNEKASHKWEWDDRKDLNEDVKAFFDDICFLFEARPGAEDGPMGDAFLRHRINKVREHLGGIQQKEVSKSVPKKGGERGERETVTETVEVDPLVEVQKRAQKFKKENDNAPGIARFLTYISSDPYLKVSMENFDRDREALNTPGGLYNLRTLECATVTYENTVMKSTSVAPDLSAGDDATPRYDAVLESAFPDPEVREYFDMAMGVTLIGGQYLQQFYYLWGAGGSGKGTLMNVAQAIFGKGEHGYSAHVNSDMFVQGSRAEHATQYMQFLGARLVVTDEIPENATMDSKKTKSLTGDDPITGRYMGKNHVTFDPTHTLWFTSNYRAKVSHSESGIWRRMRVMNTPVGVATGKRQGQLDKIIVAEEAPAILARWMKAARKYLTEGFYEPAAVQDELRDYQAEQDSVGKWLTEGCSLHYETEDPGQLSAHQFAVGKVAREHYLAFCRSEGYEPVDSLTALTREINRVLGQDATTRKSIDGAQVRGYKGVKLLDRWVTANL